jgi:hypothetical protein
MPRPCHALTMPFFSRPRHSTAFERRPVGYLPAFSFFRLPLGVPRRLLSEAYQSSSQRSIPMTVKSGNSTLQKIDLLNCWTSSSDISGYHADFHEGHGTVGAGQGRGMACENWRHGTAGERHGHGMLCVNRPLILQHFYRQSHRTRGRLTSELVLTSQQRERRNCILGRYCYMSNAMGDHVTRNYAQISSSLQIP